MKKKKKKNPHESLCHLKTQFDRSTAQLLEQCPYKLIEREPTPAEAGIRKAGKTINFYINVSASRHDRSWKLVPPPEKLIIEIITSRI